MKYVEDMFYKSLLVFEWLGGGKLILSLNREVWTVLSSLWRAISACQCLHKEVLPIYILIWLMAFVRGHRMGMI